MYGSRSLNHPCLVTGANGFLGYALTARLARQGAPVRVLLRKASQAQRFRDLKVQIAIGDLSAPETLQPAVADVAVVFHCAACSSDWGPWPEFAASNIDGVGHLIKAVSRGRDLQRFVHISSTDVYGYPTVPGDETTPLRDVGLPYNRSKIAGERLVWAAAAEGLPVTVLRPATIYGPGSTDFVTTLATLLSQRQMLLINGGRSSPGLLYIDNAVDALLAAATTTATLGQAYNLRDESAETWGQYLRSLAHALGLPAPWLNLPEFAALGFAGMLEAVHRICKLQAKPLLTRHAVYLMSRDAAFAIGKAQRDFGFCSAVSFDEAVSRSAEWFTSCQESTKSGPRLAR